MSQEEINRAVRRTRKARPLGPDATCWKCGCADPTMLHRRNRKIWCYECASLEDGKPAVEEHHLLGEANDPTKVGTPGNLHRVLSDAQIDWPHEVRFNTERDPLLWLAALCRSLRDIFEAVLGWLEYIALFLEGLSQALREWHGPRWWDVLGVGDLGEIWGGQAA